ncbi:lycopene cyclase family protein [Corynebacterium sp.]|uniref:lycopene cyclase family protein n=1 Tax=Corynebacterium sp. TaxID=1720 RepID=UPI003B3B77A0
MHIAVLGLGPAGALLAYRAAVNGWTVDAYDPACRQTDDGGILPPRWRQTYGLFPDDLPGWARSAVVFATAPSGSADPGDSGDLEVVTPAGRKPVGRNYRMVDREATCRRLSEVGPRLRLHREKVSDPDPRRLGVDAVVDCRGVVDRPGDLRQIAYGVVVAECPDSPIPPDSPVFMDWCPASSEVDPGTPPSFLYVQPVDGGTLYEETILVTREPTRPMVDLLKARLAERLPDIDLTPGAPGIVRTETVRFPVDRRARGWYGGMRDGVGVFGAAGGMTHPATGYSVAESAAAVDRMLRVVESGALPWRERLSAALAYRLRLLGAELVTAADGPTLQRFFDAFFDLPPRLQTGYLAGQHGGRVGLTMLALARYPRRVLPFLRPLPRILWDTVGRRPDAA